MKKHFLPLLALIFTPFLGTAQTFVLNKNLTVGCYNANPLTDMTKKVVIEMSDIKGKMTIASLSCSKDIETDFLANLGSAKAYYSLKDKKGFIVDGDFVSLFIEDGGKYSVAVAGHQDKKLAKSVSNEEQDSKYKELFAGFDKYLSAAKEAKAAADKAANTATVPAGNYSDKFKISGVYYLSREGQCSKTSKYINTVNLEFLPEEHTLKIHYLEGQSPDIAYVSGISHAVMRNQGYVMLSGINSNKVNIFDNKNLVFIEEGLFLVEVAETQVRTQKLDCSGPEYYNPSNRTLLMGKDKARVDALIKDPAALEKLLLPIAVKRCEYLNLARAEKTPLPAEGMKDEKLRAEAFECIKAKAVIGRWPQTMDHCYIKNSEWNTIRNKSTGVILARSIRVISVMTTDGGKCQWEEIEIKQDYNGSSYGKSYFNGNTGNIVPVDCATAMKYKK